MINSTKTNIQQKYFNLVAKDKNGYIKNSWEEISYNGTDFQYYKSRHDLDGQNKVIYHFIFDLPTHRKVHRKSSTIKHK